MKKIGIVDIDTSHPGAWIPIERELGYEVVGFYDSGAVHPPEVAQRFAAEHGVPAFPDLASLVAAVDIGMLHSCDWDTRGDRAGPFLEAGKAVFIDKPLGGNILDLKVWLEWEARGARLAGGSANLYAPEITDYRQRTSRAAGTRAHTVLCGCGVDDFNYAIHAVSAAFAVLGFGWSRVRTSADGPLQVSHVLWDDGAQAVVTYGRHPWLPTHLTLIAESGVEQVRLGIDELYRSTLRTVLPYLAGEAPAPLTWGELIQPELALLAAQRSLREGGRWVARGEMDAGGESYDGRQFSREYRRQRYGDG